jgi:putative toxin-antitoxin system antitoxin component (TIGR02293 family)
MVYKHNPIARPRKGKKSDAHVVMPTGVIRNQVHIDVINRNANIDLVGRVTGVSFDDHEQIINVVRSGIQYTALNELEKGLNCSAIEVATLLSIPRTTLARRKTKGKLNTEESDRAVRYARLKDAALELFGGDNEAAVDWLRTPKDILCDETPLVHAKTEIGARDVEDLIGRLQHGVFS